MKIYSRHPPNTSYTSRWAECSRNFQVQQLDHKRHSAGDIPVVSATLTILRSLRSTVLKGNALLKSIDTFPPVHVLRCLSPKSYSRTANLRGRTPYNYLQFVDSLSKCTTKSLLHLRTSQDRRRFQEVCNAFTRFNRCNSESQPTRSVSKAANIHSPIAHRTGFAGVFPYFGIPGRHGKSQIQEV